MMKRYLIPTIAALIALAGCSKEVREQRVQPADSSSVHALSVEIESGAYQAVGGETKASLEAIIRVQWKEGDEVSVVNANTSQLLGGCLKAQSDGESVVFEGTVTGAIAQDDKLYYIYPRVKDNTAEEDFAGYSISLAGQTYDGDNIGDVCFYGYAEDQAGSTNNTISRKIKFNLVTSYVHLNMANLPAKSTSLSRIDISNVNEGFTWTLSEKTLSAKAYAGEGSISVKCGNANITSYGNAVARFAIPASAGTTEARVITVNNAYTNDKYTRNELLAAAYYNQLYTTWESKEVKVNKGTDKTEVKIDNNDSKDVAEGAIPTDAFGEKGQDPKPTEISIGGMGTIIFDKEATARILENASGSTSVLFKVEDVTTTKPVEKADIVYEVTMKTLDEKGTEVFPDVKDSEKTPGRATVSIPLENDVAYVHTITLVDSLGNPTYGGVVPGSIHLDSDKHILTFQVEHFSKYAVGYVKAKDFVQVTGVSLNKEAMTLAVGENETLTATVAPEEATNKKVTWTSSNKDVATVDKDGKVTAVAAGTATITVTTEDGNKTATCTVTVKAYTVTVAEDITGGTITTDPSGSVAWGTEVTVTATPSEGYELDGSIAVNGTSGSIEVTGNKFTMPKEDVTVSGSFKKTAYTITKAGATHGSFTVKKDDTEVGNANYQDEITIAATPADGYIVEAITVKGTDDEQDVTVTEGKFTMPAKAVTVTVTFKKVYSFKVDASNTKVVFAPGNLYAKKDGSTWKWGFYEKQYKFHPTSMEKISTYGGQRSANSSDTEIDLFCWGYSANSTNPISSTGISGHTSDGDKFGTKEDWGSIAPSPAPYSGGWRTLSKTEWEWLLGPNSNPNPGTNCRTSSTVNGTANARYLKCKVSDGTRDVYGLMIFPDTFTWPSEAGDAPSSGINTVGLAWKSVPGYSETQFKALEEAGVVFLPAAGYRYNGTKVLSVGSYGYYWSSTANDGGSGAYYLIFYDSNVNPTSSSSRNESRSVRLVSVVQ